MAHTQNEIVQSRIELSAAIHREIDIHTKYISALKNALAGMKLVAAVDTPVPIDPKIIDAEVGITKHNKPTSLMGMLRREENAA